MKHLNWSAAVRAAGLFVLRVAYMLGITALCIASVALLDETDIMIVKASITKGFLVFAIAATSVILAQMFVYWRFGINPVEAFNALESSERKTGLGIFLGFLVLGLCHLAASVFGST